MVGRDPQNLFPPYVSHADGRSGPGDAETSHGRRRTTSTSSCYRGEILGIGGLVGHGQEDFMMGLYGAVPANADQFRRIHARRRSSARAFHEGGRRQRRRRRLHSRLIAARKACSFPHSIDFNLLLPLFARRSLERRRGGRNPRLTERMARRLNIRGDRRRPAQALVRRQSAEGRPVQMASARAVGPPAERPDPRRRC